MEADDRAHARLRNALVLVTTTVAGLGLVAELVGRLVPEAPSDLVDAFSLSVEGNVPTWYASTLLAAASALLAMEAVVARARSDRRARHWTLLSLLFAYVSLDETACFHERLNPWIDGRGIFFFGWVLVALPLLVVLSLVFLPFLRSLPSPTRNRFVLAALLYVGGAVGVELPLGAYTEAHGDAGLAYALIDFVEESLELAGVTVFLRALLDHLRASGARWRIEAEEPS